MCRLLDAPIKAYGIRYKPPLQCPPANVDEASTKQSPVFCFCRSYPLSHERKRRHCHPTHAATFQYVRFRTPTRPCLSVTACRPPCSLSSQSAYVSQTSRGRSVLVLSARHEKSARSCPWPKCEFLDRAFCACRRGSSRLTRFICSEPKQRPRRQGKPKHPLQCETKPKGICGKAPSPRT